MDFKKYSKYFSSKEFDSPDLLGSGENMNEEFISKLYEARIFSGCPFVITSGYRTINHNDALKKKYKVSPDSPHQRGNAADIMCNDSATRWRILNGLIKAGFRRIGIGKNFIHCDIEDSKTKKCINLVWTYY